MNHKLTWQALERLKAFGWKYFWHNQPISFCEAYIIAPMNHRNRIWLARDTHLRVAVKQCKGPVSQFAQAGDMLPVYDLTAAGTPPETNADRSYLDALRLLLASGHRANTIC